MGEVVLVIAPERFRDEEVVDARGALTAVGHDVWIASTRTGPRVGDQGGVVTADRRLQGLRGDEWDAVVFIGGPGTRLFWDDPDAIRLAREAHRAGRVVAAICHAPVILANAGLLAGRHATVLPDELHRLARAGALFSHLGVVVDGNLVTADGPERSARFAAAIVDAIEGVAHPMASVAAVPELWAG